jgi:hypothetical protein
MESELFYIGENLVRRTPDGLLVELAPQVCSIVDDNQETWTLLTKYVWRLHTVDTKRKSLYMARRGGKGSCHQRIAFHRELLGVVSGSDIVRFINGNGLDCRKQNLALAPKYSTLREHSTLTSIATTIKYRHSRRSVLVRWKGDDNVAHTRTFSAKRYGNMELAYEAAVTYSDSPETKHAASISPAIKNLLN